MKLDQYKKALRLAKKSYQACVINGENPYLPALDDILKNVSIVSEVNLGLEEISIKKIVGTKTHSRSTAFAKNYMPILGINTEFATKWDILCDIHLKEGIRDPLKVYEYLNRYYVMEGNKRASVLKFYGAVTITANVTRLIPKKDDTFHVKLYYEYLKFYDKSRVNYVWFSKLGKFEELLKYMGTGDNKWTLEQKQEFNQLYSRFKRIYVENGGEAFKITTGDAFLEYIKVYGYKKENKKNDKEFLRSIKNVWSEFELLETEEAVDLLTKPVDNTKKSLISSITSMAKTRKKVKVAFVYAKTKETSGWTYGHELGRLHLEEVFKDQIETSYIDNIPENASAYKYIKALAKEGNDIIFTTVPTMINPTLKAAVEFPDVKFLNCSENMSYKHLRTYYGRIYEPKFLSGMIAGVLTKTNKLAYVANYPIAGVINGINAFALGAKLVNPEVKVKLIWDSIWKEENNDKDLKKELGKEGIDIVSNQESMLPGSNVNEFGVYSLKEVKNKRVNLGHKYIALPIWHWGAFYEKLIQSILSGTWNAVNDMFSNGTRAINYWWGLNAGVVDLIYSKSEVPAETKKLIEFMRRMIVDGEFHPFTGPIFDTNNTLRVKADEVLSNEEILTMNWLVDNVIGEIPTMETEVSLTAPIVDMLGVKVDDK